MYFVYGINKGNVVKNLSKLYFTGNLHEKGYAHMSRNDLFQFYNEYIKERHIRNNIQNFLVTCKIQ